MNNYISDLLYYNEGMEMIEAIQEAHEVDDDYGSLTYCEPLTDEEISGS